MFSKKVTSGRGGTASEKMKFPLSLISGKCLPRWTAQEAGHFKRNGLDVDRYYEGVKEVAQLTGQKVAASRVSATRDHSNPFTLMAVADIHRECDRLVDRIGGKITSVLLPFR